MDARELHAASLVADAHNDLLMAVVARPPDQWSNYFRSQWLPQLRAGNVGLQVLPVFVDTKDGQEGTLRQMLRMIECAHVIAEGSPDDVLLCSDGTQLDEAVAAGRTALVLALEGVPGVGRDVELLRTFHRLGVRIASLTHLGRSTLADGSAEDAALSRLTSDGVAAICAMEEMGMILDVSHLSASGLGHVLEISRRPVMATHSSARALCDHHRNLTDELLRGIAETGGIVCINAYAPFLHPTDHSVGRLVDHIEHVVQVVGVRHVGLGPDFVKEVLSDVTPPSCEAERAHDAYIPGLEGPAGLPLITEALVDRGWRSHEVQAVLGDSLRGFLDENLA